MFDNFRYFLPHTTHPSNVISSLVGTCFILFAMNLSVAWGQVSQNFFPTSEYLDSIRYQAPLGGSNLAFFEFAGSQETEDPLQDFFTYLHDPVNWDLTASGTPRIIYQTHTGVQTHQHFLNKTTMIRFGLETMLEDTHVQSISLAHAGHVGQEQRQHLIDAVIAPYFQLESQPFPWLRTYGNLKLNVLSFDIHRTCQTTCSLPPRGQGNTTVPSFKGSLQFGPWANTQLFINMGKGFYRFDDRAPIGSSAEQQINRTRFIEFGFMASPGSQTQIQGSFWTVRSNTDYSYNWKEEEFQTQGSSQRFSFKVDGRIGITNETTLTGGLAISRITFRKPSQPVPLTPQVIGRAGLQRNWNSNWSTTIQWQYIGKQKTDNQEFPGFHNLDMFAYYQYPIGEKYGNLRASLGIINLGNHRSPYSLFHFDSGQLPEQNLAIDIAYFPGQPRTIVSGISWIF